MGDLSADGVEEEDGPDLAPDSPEVYDSEGRLLVPSAADFLSLHDRHAPLDVSPELLSAVDPSLTEKELRLYAEMEHRRDLYTEPTQVWLFGARSYLDVLATTPYDRFVFSGQDLRARPWNPYKSLRAVLPNGTRFQMLVVNRHNAELFDSERLAENPKAPPEALPIWNYGDSPETLIRFCKASPHYKFSRIVIGDLPRDINATTERVRTLEWLHRVATAYPEARLHLAFGRSYQLMFGLNWHSAGYHPGREAHLGLVRLPNGRDIQVRTAHRHLKWVHVLGFSVPDLGSYENRVRFNLASALWAARHWDDPDALVGRHGRNLHARRDPLGLLESPGAQRRRLKHVTHKRYNVLDVKVPHTGEGTYPPGKPDNFGQFSPDPTEPYALTYPVSMMNQGSVAGFVPIPVSPRGEIPAGDKVLCNACSLAPKCKAFREGAVCVVESSPMNRIAQMFATRDVDVITGALTRVLAMQADRYERSAEEFRDDGSDTVDLKRSAHLLKMEDSLIKSGEALVKLLDPAFRGTSSPAVANTTMHVYNPRVLVAEVVKELENRGIDRAAIDASVVQQVITARTAQPEQS